MGKKLQLKEYSQLQPTEFTQEDSNKLWEFLFDKVIELREERSRNADLPKLLPAVKNIQYLQKESIT